MVHLSLEPDSAINFVHAPSLSATAARLTHAQSGRTSSSKRLAYPSGMVCLSQQLSNSVISQRATDLILNSWRPGTQKRYCSAWQQYCRWCRTQQVDPFRATLSHITEFLTHEFDAGKGYRTIYSYRSVLYYAVDQHHSITRLSKGMFHDKPPVPPYAITWNVDTVLKYLKTLHPVSELPLKSLTLKLAALLALASAQRAQ